MELQNTNTAGSRVGSATNARGTNARIFQRADAFNSLNVFSTSRINFSLQTDRATGPTTGTIFLQVDDANGITIHRPVINNQTFNSIGNISA